MRRVWALTLVPLAVACASGQSVGGGDGDGEGAGGSDAAGSAGSNQSGAAGKATAGSGTAGSGTSGSGTAGSGTAGSGTSGSGTAGSGTSGSGTSGSGTAGSGTAGSGTAGSGTAGSGTAGSGTAGSAGGGTACDAALAKLTIDFESATPQFVHAAMDGASAPGWPIDEWARGTPSGAGPGGCHGGTMCWGTRLDGNITACERADLRSPAVDVSACAAESIVVELWHWFDFVQYDVAGTGYADGGILELSGDGGTTWVPSGVGNGTVKINGDLQGNACVKATSFYVDGKTGFVGKSAGWEKVTVPVPPALRTAKLKMRFAYGTGVNHASSSATENALYKAPGWYVDDVRVTK